MKEDRGKEYSSRRIVALENLSRAGRKLGNIDLTKAHLSQAHLSQAHLSGAHLSGAHLSQAHLSQAHLSQAHLNEAELNEAELRNADFTEDELFGKVDNLKPEQIKSACYWKEAKFDQDFQK